MSKLVIALKDSKAKFVADAYSSKNHGVKLKDEDGGLIAYVPFENLEYVREVERESGFRPNGNLGKTGSTSTKQGSDSNADSNSGN